jgi:outer membrane protein assembly factor BamB
MKIVAKTILITLIENITSFDNNGIVFIDTSIENSKNSNICVVLFDDDKEANDIMEIDNYIYFLEISIINEVIEVWSFTHDGKLPTLDQLCDALIYYYDNDAYIL